MPKAYLTIDDSPSPDTEKLVDFLVAREIPAILFVRGALMEQNPRAIEYAIKNDILIANHSYAHIPAGEMEPQDWADDLELCDHLIEAAYRRCDKARKIKLYRFPYIDRGDGIKIEQCDKTTINENEKTQVLQDYLHSYAFRQPFKRTPPGYPRKASDCLYTFTSRDWMLNDKHRGKHEIKTREDLIARIDEDQGLMNEVNHQILLFHDQPGICDDVCAAIAYLQDKKGFEFLDVLETK
ncbi:MAG: polysaccharide deacetylase family protein [Alphaproteobacteria bacterium]